MSHAPKTRPVPSAASQRQAQPPAPPPIRIGRVVVRGSQVELDQDFADLVNAHARTKAFGETTLHIAMALADLHRAMSFASMMAEGAMANGDHEGVECFASLAIAIQTHASLFRAELHRHWPPGDSPLRAEPAELEHPVDLEAEAAAAEELRRQREAMQRARESASASGEFEAVDTPDPIMPPRSVLDDVDTTPIEFVTPANVDDAEPDTERIETCDHTEGDYECTRPRDHEGPHAMQLCVPF